MLRTLSLLVLALVSASLPAQDEARVLNTFKKAFAAPKGKKPGAPLAEKQAALKAAQIAAVRADQQCCYRGVNYCR